MADSCCCLQGILKSQCLVVFVFLLCLSVSRIQGLDTCIAVKTAYAEKGLDESDVPVRAISGAELLLCPNTESCCTRTMEEKLTSLSRKEHAAQLDKMLSILQKTFVSRRRKFDEFFTKLIDSSESGLNDMFVETYGLLYKQNAQIFKDLFKELRRYYGGRDMDLMDVMGSFFNRLLLRMFQLLNSSFQPDDRYMQCVADSMEDLKPFKDVPVKLSMHIKRAFIAARTFVQGLAVGRDVITTIMEIPPSESCLQAVVRMMHCPYCRGLTATKPCNNFCLNTMKGCLASHAELNAAWNEYITALVMLANRLDGPFNIETVVTPIDVEISNAIMNLQDNGPAFTEKITNRCGQPRKSHSGRKKRSASAQPQQDDLVPSAAYFNQPAERKRKQQHTFDHHRDCSASNPCLDKMVKELKEKIEPYKDFWVQLPYMVCQDEKVAADATLEDDCWNGKDRARYIPEVQKDGVLHQLNNPEVEVDINAVNSVVSRQKAQLQIITNKMKTAFKGDDVIPVDVEADTFVSGSGSGDDLYIYDDDDDDEDDEDYDDDEYIEYDDTDIDDEDSIAEGSGKGQGRGSGGHGFATDFEDSGMTGIVNIDNFPNKYSPGSRGGHSRGGRGDKGRGGGQRGGRGHKKGGNRNYPNWDNADLGFGENGRDPSMGGTGNFNKMGGTANNVPPISNTRGRMYNRNKDKNNNVKNQNNREDRREGELPSSEEEKRQGVTPRSTASTGAVANFGLVLLLSLFHFVVSLRFAALPYPIAFL